MKFSLHFSGTAFVLILLTSTIMYIANLHDDFLVEWNVGILENIQAFSLMLMALFTWFYMKPDHLPAAKKLFWMWAVTWWILLFGRSVSWGRDYFPEVQHIYFRIISIVLIVVPIAMLFLKTLRQEIIYKFKHVKLPFWYLLIAVITLIFADAVEHTRFIFAILIDNQINKDIVEELYEVPFILALFFSAFEMMKIDKYS